MKDLSEISIVKHVVGWWVALPLLLVLLLAGGARVFGADGAQINLMLLLSGLLGITFGWAVGLVSYLLHRGVRGWRNIHHLARQRWREGQRQAQIDAATQAPLTPAPSSAASPAGSDPWNGRNPYGCCQGATNRDAQGRMFHGGPGCIHPDVVQAQEDLQDYDYQEHEYQD